MVHSSWFIANCGNRSSGVGRRQEAHSRRQEAEGKSLYEIELAPCTLSPLRAVGTVPRLTEASSAQRNHLIMMQRYFFLGQIFLNYTPAS
jgi:hypothetical protein